MSGDGTGEPRDTAGFIGAAGGPSAQLSFTQTFRGYAKEEVDRAVLQLRAHAQRAAAEADELRRDHQLLKAQVAESQKLKDEAEAQRAHDAAETARLQDELAMVTARLTAAEQRVQALAEELRGPDAGNASPSRESFEEVLRVAEEQASTLITNAAVQADKLLTGAKEQAIQHHREVESELQQLREHAQHEVDQQRLKLETELVAHRTLLEREAAAAAEAREQAEREAAAILAEAEKEIAVLRAEATRETEQMRADAEKAVRELRAQALDFEQSLTRRQEDAQQEFLTLHNQAVAHAERLTSDANAQVQAALESAQRISIKADDYEKLARAQARRIEADAQVRAAEQLERAREKAQTIVDTVTQVATTTLRDAEDRARQLRWQQHQLTSFMSEIRQLIAPELTAASASGGVGTASADDSPELAVPHASDPEPVEPEQPGAEHEPEHTAGHGSEQQPSAEHAQNGEGSSEQQY